MAQCGGSAPINSSAGNSAPASVLPQSGGYAFLDLNSSVNQAPAYGRGRVRRITRKGYTRKAHSRTAYSRKGHVHVRRATVKRSRVPEGRIPDQGAPGKWADKHGPGIVMEHPGALSSVGYSVVAKPTRRHSALRKAVRKFGPLSTFRKLQAVGTYTKRTSKGRSKKFMADRNWVRKTYM
jgi:Family of unknown function (DUF5771)